ncbi:response regulator transcription factor [Saccharothrix coeruleofusca]|uniref:DNA-binding response regulator n=1 Tax=Saccharothrix coeruleofusca TaxID=33919 RepID=A0A918ATA8_9PSEU|nr:response regulator transcription factor [Saccharothrix coeruleofusca]MBP2337337.1 DNA-binding NarL/FixJ family response regulator [Saccharothrix coeruleofusca]GGP81413.1 DNA-binding response regulator [Saccharothrix coeruleofusca]
MISVLIAEDQAMVRAGFRLILEAQPDVEVVADVADGVSAVQRARELLPQVCLVDVRMPGLDGLEVTRQLAPHTRVVVVTTFDSDEVLQRALDLGACGFLTKDASPGLLVEAVRSAARGEALVSPQVVSRVLRRSASPVPTSDADVLTPRELEVVRHVARGLSNNEIASAMRISLSSVKTHLASVQGKVGARNRVEIVTWAFRARVVAG